MKLKDLRPEFDILIIEPVTNTSENYLKMITVAGYRANECNDPIEAISVVRNRPPHIILFSTSDLEASKRQIEALASISSEFQIILLTNKSQVLRALNMVEQEAIFDFVTLPLNSPSELISKADRAAEKLYLFFQSRKLMTSFLAAHLQVET